MLKNSGSAEISLRQSGVFAIKKILQFFFIFEQLFSHFEALTTITKKKIFNNKKFHDPSKEGGKEKL
jgi:hypothetical protein